MQPSLVATKVTVPPPPPRALNRPHLLHALTRQLPHARLTLVTAPAGYGKTTLLAQWARHDGAPPVAWLSLDEADDDLERFFRYLLAAWEQAQPGVMDSPLGLLLGSIMPDDEAVLAAFVNVAHERDTRTVFVLDDYHLIADPTIHSALTFLLDHLPPSLTFVLACRAEPPLPLARYRARRQLLELRPPDLHFSAAETASFFEQIQGLALDPDDVDRLHRQCEGWVAGLQLAALGLQRRGDDERPIAVGGRQRFIADYLAQDVLARQAPPVRDFLLRSSILQRLSGPLCDAVLNVNAAQDRPASQQMLQRLERENLFLEPLDENRHWYRYHALFAEFLQEEARRSMPQQLAGLHRRAAEWHLAQDLPQQAFDHAIAAGDLQLVVRVAERYFFVMLHAGEFKVLTAWLDALPPEWYRAYPAFGLARAGVYAFSGALDACFRCIEEVEQDLTPPQSDQERQQLARATAVRCFVACFQNDLARAEGYAGEALEALHEEDFTFRADTYQALGDAYRRNGRWSEAEHCYRKVLEFAHAPAYRAPAFHATASRPQDAGALALHAYGALADLQLRQGRLHDAAAYWLKAQHELQDPQNWGRVSLPVSGWVHVRMGEILYEWNELKAAQEHLARGLQRAELSGDVRAQLAAYLLAARLHLTHGDHEAASRSLQQVEPLLEGAPFDEWHSRFERLQLELWLAQDHLRAALHWADQTAASIPLRSDDFSRPPPGETASPLRSDDFSRQLTLARLLIVKSDNNSLHEAAARLKQVRQAVEDQGRLGLHVEALALQALLHRRRGDDAAALTALEQALRLAQPEGYVRLFADLGLPMARLLQEARSRDVLPDTVQALLDAFGDGLVLPAAQAETLPEPLTPREHDVLELLAAGLTNREIGEQLVISPQTVKKHAGNIYGKLNAGNRTEAVARARDLKLL